MRDAGRHSFDLPAEDRSPVPKVVLSADSTHIDRLELCYPFEVKAVCIHIKQKAEASK